MIKKILLLFIVLLFLILPILSVFAAEPGRGQRQEVKTRESKEAPETEKPDEDIGQYVKKRAQEMKGQDNEKKKQTRVEITAKVKERLRLVIQRTANRYEKVKDQVLKSNLSEEEKLRITKQLDAQIEKLNLLTAELEVVEDIAELKAAIKKVQTDFKVSLGLVRQSIKGFYEERLTKIVEKINAAFGLVSDRVEGLEEGEKKEELRLQLVAARELINTAETAIESGNFFEARGSLVAAREALRQIIEEIKLTTS